MDPGPQQSRIHRWDAFGQGISRAPPVSLAATGADFRGSGRGGSTGAGSRGSRSTVGGERAPSPRAIDTGSPSEREPAASDTYWDFLTGDTAQDQRNVRILLESLGELYGPLALEDLMRRAVDRALHVTGAQRGMLLLDAGDGTLETAVSRDRHGRDQPLDERRSESVIRKVWHSGEPCLMVDLEGLDELDLTHSINGLQLLSVMGVPMPVKGRNLGVLYVDSKQAAQNFTRADMSVFQALGGLVALAVENARLLAEKAQQDRLKRELLLAQEIQQGLLPDEIPQPAGFDIAGVSRPCEETSGDYYDVIPFGEDRYALLVGDVSGHGMGPAMLMASTCALLHTGLRTNTDPAEVIRSVNLFLECDAPDDAFMTMFLGVLDPATRELRYVSAGHEPPLLCRPDGTLEELGRTGLLLGVLEDATYRLADARTLESGEVLFLYTDGIYEAHSELGEMYGEDRFRASFLAHAREERSASDILSGVLADLRRFVGKQPLEDDVTCLVVRVV